MRKAIVECPGSSNRIAKIPACWQRWWTMRATLRTESSVPGCAVKTRRPRFPRHAVPASSRPCYRAHGWGNTRMTRGAAARRGGSAWTVEASTSTGPRPTGAASGSPLGQRRHRALCVRGPRLRLVASREPSWVPRAARATGSASCPGPPAPPPSRRSWLVASLGLATPGQPRRETPVHRPSRPRPYEAGRLTPAAGCEAPGQPPRVSSASTRPWSAWACSARYGRRAVRRTGDQSRRRHAGPSYATDLGSRRATAHRSHLPSASRALTGGRASAVHDAVGACHGIWRCDLPSTTLHSSRPSQR